MVKRRPMFVLALLLLVLTLMSMSLLAACGGDDTDTTASPETTAAATETTAAATDTTAPATETTAGSTETSAAAGGSFDGEIVIGALNSMTGPNAMTGAEQKWAYDRAVADINAAGGVDMGGKKMEMVLKYIDDKSDTVEVVTAAEKLIKVEGCQIVLSSNISPGIFASATGATEKYGAYYHTVYPWVDQLRAQNYKMTSGMFFTPAIAGEVPFQVADLMPEAERPKAWTTVMEDTADGQGLADGIAEQAKKHNTEIKYRESFTAGTKDFSSLILKMKQNNVDAILVLCTPTDGITFLKQMKEQNFSPKLVYGFKGFWPNEFSTSLGPDADYVGHDGFWSEDLPYPHCKELGQQYRDEHKGQDSVAIGMSYASVQILAEAMKRAGSIDPVKVRDEVFGGSFPGTTMGDVTYAEDGTATIPSLGLWWKDGTRQIFWPDQGNKFEWFVPWNER